MIFNQERQVKQAVNSNIKALYGFMLNILLSPKQSASPLVEQQDSNLFPNLPSNMVFHDLTKGQTESKNSWIILGIGLKFIPTPQFTTSPEDIKPQINQFEQLLKLRTFYAGKEGDEPLPKLRLSSKWIPLKQCIPKEVMNCLAAFRQALIPQFKRWQWTPKNQSWIQFNPRYYTISNVITLSLQ